MALNVTTSASYGTSGPGVKGFYGTVWFALFAHGSSWHYRHVAEPDYLTPEQVAKKLQMNARVVCRMLATGKLPGKRVGRIWRTSALALREFIESGELGKPAVPKGE